MACPVEGCTALPAPTTHGLCVEHWIHAPMPVRAPAWYRGDWQETHARARAYYEESEGSTMSGLNLKQSPKQGQCDAMRCTEAPSVEADGAAWGRGIVRLCARHEEQARKAGMRAPGRADAEIVDVAPPEAEAAAATSEALAIVSEARAFEITTQDEIEFAAEVLGEIKAKAKALEDREKTITRPINDALKAARALFKPAREHLAEAESVIKRAIAAFHDATAERHRLAMAEASAAHAAGDTEGAALALATVATLDGVAGVRTSRVWDFEITDPLAVPPVFTVPDVVAIRAEMRRAVEMGIEPEIPGVRFFQTTRVSAGRGV